MRPSSTRVASRWVLSKQELELRWYDLEGLTDGSTVILWHGSTKKFDRFDVSKSREELVKDYYGGGIFLTPRKPIAWDYAQANRNIGFDPSLIDEMKRVNANAGDFMERLFRTGRKAAWRELTGETLPKKYPGIELHEAMDKYFGSADPHDIEDVAEYLIGSKSFEAPEDDTMEQLMGLMGGGQRTGAPDWLYNKLDQLGLDGDAYRPKVYRRRQGHLQSPDHEEPGPGPQSEVQGLRRRRVLRVRGCRRSSRGRHLRSQEGQDPQVRGLSPPRV